MRDIYTDRDYFDRMFASIDDNFVEVKGRLDKINNNKIPSMEGRLGCLEERNKIDDEIKKRWWVKYKRTLETMAVVIAFLALLYMNWNEKRKTTEIEKTVKGIKIELTPNRSMTQEIFEQLKDSVP